MRRRFEHRSTGLRAMHANRGTLASASTAHGRVVLRLNEDGTRFWVLERTKGVRILGSHPDLSLAQAVARACEIESAIEAAATAPPVGDELSRDPQAGRDPRPLVEVREPRAPLSRRAFLQGSLATAGTLAIPAASADELPLRIADHAKLGKRTTPREEPEPDDDDEPDLPRGAKAWIHKPTTFGSASYVRYSPINIVRGTIKVELRSNVALESVTIKVVGHKGDILRSPEFKAPPYLWELDTRRLPEGNLVIDAEITPRVPFLHAVVVVDNDHAPVTGEQWIPVGARNTLDEFTSKAWGYEWVRYPGVTRGTHLPVRPGIPFDKRKPRSDLWQQAMTSTSITRFNPSRQFTTLYGGHISVVERQPYTQQDNFRLLLGNCIDGPYGVGRVGSVWNGYVDARGSLVAITGQGRGVRINLDGSVETLIGPRLRRGVAAPILPPSPRPEQLAWLESFYEHVGTITDGPPRLNNPWQMIADPRNPDLLYIADSDNNRVVVYDARARVGRTLAGGTEGFADGVGASAQFNRPRGLAWSPDGDILYVADDHNSAIRTLNRQGVVGTLVHSARGTNYDLVRREREFKRMTPFAKMIRAHMADGRFGSATFMHPNTLEIDSEGNLLAACHHPHVIIKLDLRERTVTTLVELPVDSLALHHLRLAWISMSVDRWGAFGPKDQIAVAYWMQQSFRLYDKDGKPTGYYIGPEKAPSSGFLENGPVSKCMLTSYPSFCTFGPDGSFWHGGTAGDGVYRQTLRREGDPDIDAALYKRGRALYTSGVPAPMYRRGWRGHSHLGETSFYDFADRSDADIAEWIRSTWPTKYDDADLAALVYYIRWNA